MASVNRLVFCFPSQCNKTTQLYNQEEAVQIANRIVEEYAGVFDLLLQKLLSEK